MVGSERQGKDFHDHLAVEETNDEEDLEERFQKECEDLMGSINNSNNNAAHAAFVTPHNNKKAFQVTDQMFFQLAASREMIETSFDSRE